MDDRTTAAAAHDADPWAAGPDDEDVEVFVFGIDDEDGAPVAGASTVEEPLPTTLTADDVAGDDWNDESWLTSLDSFDEPVVTDRHRAPPDGPPPPSGPAGEQSAPAGDDGRPPAPGGPTTAAEHTTPTAAATFTAPTPPDGSRDGVAGAPPASGGVAVGTTPVAAATDVTDAEVAALLRELSLLVGGE